jgi:hypothetical protein
MLPVFSYRISVVAGWSTVVTRWCLSPMMPAADWSAV